MSLCGTDDKRRRTTEDRATQPMEAGGWVSQFKSKLLLINLHETIRIYRIVFQTDEK